MSICQLHSVLIPSSHSATRESCLFSTGSSWSTPTRMSMSCAKSMCFGCKQPWVQHHFCKKVNTTPSPPSHLEVRAYHTQSPWRVVGVWSVSMALASLLLTSLLPFIFLMSKENESLHAFPWGWNPALLKPLRLLNQPLGPPAHHSGLPAFTKSHLLLYHFFIQFSKKKQKTTTTFRKICIVANQWGALNLSVFNLNRTSPCLMIHHTILFSVYVSLRQPMLPVLGGNLCCVEYSHLWWPQRCSFFQGYTMQPADSVSNKNILTGQQNSPDFDFPWLQTAMQGFWEIKLWKLPRFCSKIQVERRENVNIHPPTLWSPASKISPNDSHLPPTMHQGLSVLCSECLCPCKIHTLKS